VSKPRNVPGSTELGSTLSDNGEEEEETGVTPNMPQLSRFKCVENTNYAVDLAKANGMHLVGIQGADIVDGKKTLVLGLVWQLMRYVERICHAEPFCLSSLHRLNIVKTLTALSGNNRPISDTEILKWANSKVSSKPGSKTIRSFKDPSISTGIWFLDLLDAIKPGIVDYSMVTKEPRDYEEKRQNGMSTQLHDCVALMFPY
jgi:plastin-1